MKKICTLFLAVILTISCSSDKVDSEVCLRVYINYLIHKKFDKSYEMLSQELKDKNGYQNYLKLMEENELQSNNIISFKITGRKNGANFGTLNKDKSIKGVQYYFYEVFFLLDNKTLKGALITITKDSDNYILSDLKIDHSTAKEQENIYNKFRTVPSDLSENQMVDIHNKVERIVNGK